MVREAAATKSGDAQLLIDAAPVLAHNKGLFCLARVFTQKPLG